MKSRDRLRIAMQKSGRLTEPAQDLLARCGLKFRQSRDKLFCFGEGEPVDLLLVRDDDIPGLIAEGVCDLGIVGRNVLREFQLTNGTGSELSELRPLGFGHCRLSIALPQEDAYSEPSQLHGQRIATSYPGLLGEWLRAHGVDARVVMLAGSVEIAPRLGTADAICDLVSSGATLVANQLREAAVVVESEAVLAGRAELPLDERGEIAELLLRRLDGVIQVRDSRLILMQAPRAALDAITRLLPGAPVPTLTQVDGAPDQVVLQALCAGSVSWRQLEDMKRAGARDMLVLPVEKMLA
ncbi:ATP phosphoribosyltransferase (homohexameric) [Luteibacter rhizovicinus]|uniref:ATP phosphoribosyltransferase n=1 Tax=Luteibacter rhizovicinus TaxID=242606 RepID=A0A4R3YVT7_9GAMM|nr:ATP phosphoribosyltransferase [Luteibacter rhizovicinus]TCV97245.1 ATP phosphoribosyltransferase (homohexameric) [Luteibacter rhizovicinus]